MVKAGTSNFLVFQRDWQNLCNTVNWERLFCEKYQDWEGMSSKDGKGKQVEKRIIQGRTVGGAPRALVNAKKKKKNEVECVKNLHVKVIVAFFCVDVKLRRDKVNTLQSLLDIKRTVELQDKGVRKISEMKTL